MTTPDVTEDLDHDDWPDDSYDYPDPGPSFWVSNEPGPSGFEWGCEQCPEGVAGGVEPTVSLASAAAYAHERLAHP